MLHLLTWTITGLAAGWAVRRLLRTRRDFGVAGDLVTGWFGGILGGWLFRRAGFVGPDGALGHVLVAIVGAVALVASTRALLRLVQAAGVATTAVTSTPAMALEERIRRLGELERHVLDAVLLRKPVARDPNREFDERITFGQRVADRVASFGGSWTFIGLFGIVLVSWMALNEEMAKPFDTYPFILLNLVLSCLAALQAPVIMMSQKRQAVKDRLDARNDYEVNVRSEMEIAALHTKLDLLREQEWLRLAASVERQQATLERIARRLDALSGTSEAT